MRECGRNRPFRQYSYEKPRPRGEAGRLPSKPVFSRAISRTRPQHHRKKVPVQPVASSRLADLLAHQRTGRRYQRKHRAIARYHPHQFSYAEPAQSMCSIPPDHRELAASDACVKRVVLPQKHLATRVSLLVYLVTTSIHRQETSLKNT